MLRQEIGEHGIGEHGIGEYRIGEYGIGEYGIGEMLRHHPKISSFAYTMLKHMTAPITENSYLSRDIKFENDEPW